MTRWVPGQRPPMTIEPPEESHRPSLDDDHQHLADAADQARLNEAGNDGGMTRAEMHVVDHRRAENDLRLASAAGPRSRKTRPVMPTEVADRVAPEKQVGRWSSRAGQQRADHARCRREGTAIPTRADEEGAHRPLTRSLGAFRGRSAQQHDHAQFGHEGMIGSAATRSK